MLYICIKDFKENNLDIKKSEKVDVKFGHDEGNIYCVYITYKGVEHRINIDNKFLIYFKNLSKWRSEQIENLLND